MVAFVEHKKRYVIRRGMFVCPFCTIWLCLFSSLFDYNLFFRQNIYIAGEANLCGEGAGMRFGSIHQDIESGRQGFQNWKCYGFILDALAILWRSAMCVILVIKKNWSFLLQLIFQFVFHKKPKFYRWRSSSYLMKNHGTIQPKSNTYLLTTLINWLLYKPCMSQGRTMYLLHMDSSCCASQLYLCITGILVCHQSWRLSLIFIFCKEACTIPFTLITFSNISLIVGSNQSCIYTFNFNFSK